MGISLFIVHYEYVGTTELRCLDGVEREHQDDIFGSVIGCSARTPVEELKQEWLKTGWSEDTLAHPLVYARGKSNTEKSGLTWTAHQVSMYIHLTIGWLLILLKDLGISDRRRCEAIRSVSIPVGGAGRVLMGDVETSISSLQTRRSVLACSMTMVSASCFWLGISKAISQLAQFPHETFPKCCQCSPFIRIV